MRTPASHFADLHLENTYHGTSVRYKLRKLPGAELAVHVTAAQWEAIAKALCPVPFRCATCDPARVNDLGADLMILEGHRARTCDEVPENGLTVYAPNVPR